MSYVVHDYHYSSTRNRGTKTVTSFILNNDMGYVNLYKFVLRVRVLLFCETLGESKIRFLCVKGDI